MGLFNRDKNTCTGKFGQFTNDEGDTVQGIKMKCPGHDKEIVAPGDKEEAEQKATEFLEENSLKAKIRDES